MRRKRRKEEGVEQEMRKRRKKYEKVKDGTGHLEYEEEDKMERMRKKRMGNKKRRGLRGKSDLWKMKRR